MVDIGPQRGQGGCEKRVWGGCGRVASPQREKEGLQTPLLWLFEKEKEKHLRTERKRCCGPAEAKGVNYNSLLRKLQDLLSLRGREGTEVMLLGDKEGEPSAHQFLGYGFV